MPAASSCQGWSVSSGEVDVGGGPVYAHPFECGVSEASTGANRCTAGIRFLHYFQE